MRLYSWNVNGWRAALRHGLRDWVATTPMDVLCVQETKVQAQQLDADEGRLPGFESLWAEAQRPGYSGVATFFRAPCKALRSGIGRADFDAEGRVVVTDCGDFDLYNVYFPNGKKDAQRLAFKLEFYAFFLEQVLAVVRRGRPVIFCGDVNTAHTPQDLARPEANRKVSGFLPEERAWLDRWQDAGFVDSFRHLHPEARTYSWWSLRSGARERDVGWRLDYFWVHESLLGRLKGAGIATEVRGADHCPVWLDLD
ncbi:MAG: exodeoxyribonuclease III [Acidithiobacillus sp.]|uniref:exodeoxyribonuclease III n=1 Tax=Acidithiobacillus sp. TaxID=1872118 RepID=UPI003D049A65